LATKTAAVLLDGDGLRFQVRTGSGHTLTLDDAGGDAGPRPAELIPAAVAACTAMDVISILRKKRQDVRRYEVRASGQQLDGGQPAVFTRIDVIHAIEGPGIDIEAVRRAIELSATRYCSVGGTLATGVAEIHHAYLLRDASGEELFGEVVVTGPYEQPDALGTSRAMVAATHS
jgi:putative redox protein